MTVPSIIAFIFFYFRKSFYLWVYSRHINMNFLTLSWRRPLSYRNQSTDLLGKSMDWFLYDNGLRHESFKAQFRNNDITYAIRIPRVFKKSSHCKTRLQKSYIHNHTITKFYSWLKQHVYRSNTYIHLSSLKI